MIGKKMLEQLYWSEELSTTEIAEKFGTYPCKIVRLMRRWGIPRRDHTANKKLMWKKMSPEAKKRMLRGFKKHNDFVRKWDKIPKKILVDLYWDKGLSPDQIGKMFNIHKSSVLRALIKHGIPRRAVKGGIDRYLKEHHIVDYIIKNPEKFGYKEVFLIQMNGYDLLGLREDGTVERIEVKRAAHHTKYKNHPENIDLVIAYWGSADLDKPVNIMRFDLEFRRHLEEMLALESVVEVSGGV